MSYLSETINLIKKGIPNIGKIAEAVKNTIKIELGTIPEEDLEIITARRLICATCPFMSTNATDLGLYSSSFQFEHCIHCGCPIKTRTASLESNCGIEEYNINNPDKPLPLKWHKIEEDDKK